MPGDLDEAYIQARATLLDALQGLEQQLAAVVLVGAQAVYLRTGEADVPVLPYTTDADIGIGIDPASLTDDPRLADAMSRAGFTRHPTNPGIWIHRARNVQVDLLVPAGVGGAGRRAARLGVHGNDVAMKVHGLEAALIDRSPMVVAALAQ